MSQTPKMTAAQAKRSSAPRPASQPTAAIMMSVASSRASSAPSNGPNAALAGGGAERPPGWRGGDPGVGEPPAGPKGGKSRGEVLAQPLGSDVLEHPDRRDGIEQSEPAELTVVTDPDARA